MLGIQIHKLHCGPLEKKKQINKKQFWHVILNQGAVGGNSILRKMINSKNVILAQFLNIDER